MRFSAVCLGAIVVVASLQPSSAQESKRRDRAAAQELAELKKRVEELETQIKKLQQKTATPPTADQPRVHPRTYRVADLISASDDVPPMHRFDRLMSYITTNIAPDQWEAAGGHGTMAPYPQNLSLVVSQTSEVHEKIRQLLDRLRKAKKVLEGFRGTTARPTAVRGH